MTTVACSLLWHFSAHIYNDTVNVLNIVHLLVDFLFHLVRNSF